MSGEHIVGVSGARRVFTVVGAQSRNRLQVTQQGRSEVSTGTTGGGGVARRRRRPATPMTETNRLNPNGRTSVQREYGCLEGHEGLG